MASLLLLAGLLLPLGLATPAQAQSCSASMTPITFSGMDLLGGGAVDTTATLTVTCGGVLGIVQVCASFDAGTGSGQADARQMMATDGTHVLKYQLYQDAARTTPWGSLLNPELGSVPGVGVNVVVLGTRSATRTV